MTTDLPNEGLELKPFRGVRYATSRIRDLAAVTSPPYDLIDDDAIARFMAAEPHNVVRLIRRGDSADHYLRAGETLREWLASGILVTDPDPALYVYEELGPGGSLQRGLIGGLGLRDEATRVVLPHEGVYPGPVRDRLALMRATEANLEPIFLLYEGGSTSAASHLVDDVAASREPLLETTTADGSRHRLWAITDEALQRRVAGDLRDRQALIADGHHRYATYRELQAGHNGPGPWDYGLALLVDSVAYPPLLSPIHRVLPGLPLDDAVGRAAEAFRVTSYGEDLAAARAALARHDDPAFLVGADRLFLLSDPDAAQVEMVMPADRSRRWRNLDTAVLHRLLIGRLWGISDDERNVRIVHHDADRALRRARRRGGTAVILNPLKVPDVLAVAARGETVPRKSTSFGPKPPNGLVLRMFGAG